MSALYGQNSAFVPQGVCVCGRTAADKGGDSGGERVPARAVLKTGASRAVKKEATAPGLFKEIRSSLLGQLLVCCQR
ncbi:MAG: hypothetical protein ACLR0U_29170 [Enterocloster clostridioformis]